MHPDCERIDSLLQFALLCAGEDDDFSNRQLGPIHLIKYVYLGDLAHAERGGGATYTGVEWQFYKFGPWSQSVNERIEPALLEIKAAGYTFQSDFEDRSDWVRWSLNDHTQLEALENRIPIAVRTRIRRDVRRFGKDTAALLDYVYCTQPMLNAAPNEYLHFPEVARAASESTTVSDSLKYDALSNKAKKRLSERLSTIRDRREKVAAQSLTNPVKNPRYDEIYENGVSWLEHLAGLPLSPGDYVAEFSPDVWKSASRADFDVPD